MLSTPVRRMRLHREAKTTTGVTPNAGSVGHQRRFGLHASEAPAVGQTELMTVDNAGFHWMLDYR